MDRPLPALYAEEMIRLADTAGLAEPLTACVAEFTTADAYAISREVLRRREVTSPPAPLRARRGELSDRTAIQWTVP